MYPGHAFSTSKSGRDSRLFWGALYCVLGMPSVLLKMVDNSALSLTSCLVRASRSATGERWVPYVTWHIHSHAHTCCLLDSQDLYQRFSKLLWTYSLPFIISFFGSISSLFQLLSLTQAAVMLNNCHWTVSAISLAKKAVHFEPALTQVT